MQAYIFAYDFHFQPSRAVFTVNVLPDNGDSDSENRRRRRRRRRRRSPMKEQRYFNVVNGNDTRHRRP